MGLEFILAGDKPEAAFPDVTRGATRRVRLRREGGAQSCLCNWVCDGGAGVHSAGPEGGDAGENITTGGAEPA